MTTPLFSRAFDSQTNASSSTENKRWMVQTKPNNLRLPYSHNRAFSPNFSLGGFSYVMADSLWDDLYFRAYKSFKGKIADNAQLGVAALEWRKSLGMITARATQLYDFTKAMKQLRFADAYSYLTIDPYASLHRPGEHRVRRNRLKDFSLARDANIIVERGNIARKLASEAGGAQLEKSFGWVPLMSDMYKAARLIDRPIRPKTVRGRASDFLDKSSVTYQFGYPIKLSSGGPSKVQIIADVSVNNPNLALANHLGLVNPLSIAWELVPWSFAVDWFVDFGSWLEQFSDFVGLSLDQPAVSKYHMTAASKKYAQQIGGYQYDAQVSDFYRIVGPLTGPPLQINNPFVGLSAGRAINMVSLLVQKLKAPAKFNRVI